MADENYMRLRPMCGVAECGRKAQAKAMCNTHYARWWKTGTTDAPPAFQPKPCEAEGCGRSAVCKGFCKLHYNKMLRHGTPYFTRLTYSATCEVCDKPVKGRGLCQSHLERLKKYGSPTTTWREANPKGPCILCASPILEYSSEDYCSDRCAHKARKGQANLSLCVECGVKFKSINGTKSCSDACASIRNARKIVSYTERNKGSALYAERRRMAQQRRRARVRSLEVEDFTFQEIAGRDKWKCGVCGLRVLETKRHPDPMSGSIDHIMPIVHGGGHTRVNVQLAHLRCNMKKHSKPIGQMLLIG